MNTRVNHRYNEQHRYNNERLCRIQDELPNAYELGGVTHVLLIYDDKFQITRNNENCKIGFYGILEIVSFENPCPGPVIWL